MERKAHLGIVVEPWITRTTQIDPKHWDQIQKILYTEKKSLRKFLNEVLSVYLLNRREAFNKINEHSIQSQSEM